MTACGTQFYCTPQRCHWRLVWSPKPYYLQVCGKFVLDPEDEEQCAEHLQQCSARHERVAARRASDKIEV